MAMRNDTIKRTARVAVLTALALALSYMERFIPLNLLVPLPGVKLGLANVVTRFALYALGFKEAIIIVFARCALGGLFTGSATALIMSVSGGCLSCAVMALAMRFFSVYGVSVLGAAAFNIAQVTVAALMLGSVYAYYYLPFLLLTAIAAGLLTGAAASGALRILYKTSTA